MKRPTANAVSEQRIDEEIEALEEWTGTNIPSHLRAQMVGAQWALRWVRGDAMDMPPTSLNKPWPQDKKEQA